MYLKYLKKDAIKNPYFYYHTINNEYLPEGVNKYAIWVPFIILKEDIDVLKEILQEDDRDNVGRIISEYYDSADNAPLFISSYCTLIYGIDRINSSYASYIEDNDSGTEIFSKIEYVIRNDKFLFHMDDETLDVCVGFFVVHFDNSLVFNEMLEAETDLLKNNIPDINNPWFFFYSAVTISTFLFIYVMDFLKAVALKAINKSGDYKNMPGSARESLVSNRGIKELDEMYDIISKYKERNDQYNYTIERRHFTDKFNENQLVGKLFTEVFSIYSDIKKFLDFNDILSGLDIEKESTDDKESNLSYVERLMLSIVEDKIKEESEIFKRLHLN